MNANNLVKKQRDSAEAAGFASPADLSNVPPGTEFQATWTFKNNGSTTWNGRYHIVYTLDPPFGNGRFRPLSAGQQDRLGHRRRRCAGRSSARRHRSTHADLHRAHHGRNLCHQLADEKLRRQTLWPRSLDARRRQRQPAG